MLKLAPVASERGVLRNTEVSDRLVAARVHFQRLGIRAKYNMPASGPDVFNSGGRPVEDFHNGCSVLDLKVDLGAWSLFVEGDQQRPGNTIARVQALQKIP